MPISKDLLYSEKVYTTNLTDLIDPNDLAKIGQRVCLEYKIDVKSCQEWKARTEPAVDLAMLLYEEKNNPFPGASAVKYPMLTTAAIQFNARAMANIIKGNNVVKVQVLGEDQSGIKSGIADRVGKHMSWQFMHQMKEWTEDLDKSMMCLPVVGEDWMKTYRDFQLNRNKSVRVPSQNMVYNYWYKTPEDAPRINEKIWLYPNQIEERFRSKAFRKFQVPDHAHVYDEDESELMYRSERIDPEDKDAPHLFIEQHRWLDLDGDGYREPYIVLVHKQTMEVVRVYPRYELSEVLFSGNGGKRQQVEKITPELYYTQTVFYPSPDGGSRGLGLGSLLGPLNETANALMQQTLDAGTLYNNNSGFIDKAALQTRGLGAQSIMEFELGEWKVVSTPGDDLRKAIVPLPVREPSEVLYKMLGLMIEAGKELSSVSNIMMGESPGPNTPPTSIMALIEQGLKVFTGIFKRIHRSKEHEYKKQFRLNALHLTEEEYYTMLDTQQKVMKTDYNIEAIDVVPVSDPNDVTDTQKMLKMQTYQSLKKQGYNDAELNKRVLDVMEIPDKKPLLEAPAPQPDFLTQVEMDKVKLERDIFEWDMVKDEADIIKKRAQSVKLLAEAQAVSNQQAIDAYQVEIDAWDKQLDRIAKIYLQREKIEGDMGTKTIDIEGRKMIEDAKPKASSAQA